MPSSPSKKILIVPLDWGLGHTTRCIPIIRVLLKLGHEVQVGGTELTNSLLLSEFPDLKYHIFPSYGISYPRKGEQFLNHILKQVPQIAKVVKAESKCVKAIDRQEGFDIIISDNRFGVRVPRCKNIFISHQLNLFVPQSKVAEQVANMINRRYINRYDVIAVPDFDNHLLSGSLSNDSRIKPKVIFLGSLSRWEKTAVLQERSGLLVILSGPEPQRTLLEDLIIEQAGSVDMQITIVRAKPNSKVLPIHDNITFYNHLSANALKQEVERSELVISRAGYTTIMDLVAVQQHAILIPTPGQTEQEYLVKHLQEMNLFTFYGQDSFNFKNAVSVFNKKTWGSFPSSESNLHEKIELLIS